MEIALIKSSLKKFIFKNLRLDSLNLSNSFVFYITFKLRKTILPRLQYLQTGVLLYSQVPEFQKYFSLFSSFEKKKKKYLDFSNIKMKNRNKNPGKDILINKILLCFILEKDSTVKDTLVLKEPKKIIYKVCINYHYC